MRETKAQFIIDQLNPIIKKSKNFIWHLSIDHDNEDIILENRFHAILCRVHYPERNTIELVYEIIDFLRG